MRKYLWVGILLLGLSCLTAFAQNRTITGKVTLSDDGSVMPGVSVALKGTTRGTNTDGSGNYVFSVPESGGKLVFSFVGIATQEVVIGNQAEINVQLRPDSRQLSEVVVTGTGVATDKKKLGISVESISAARLPAISNATIDQALVGKIAGAQISSSSGAPGAPVSIQLRGINTLGGGTQPLILIDGVEVTSTALNALDLSNVERVEVVQGAASATIYGAQGANGVIQIFTKRGKQGATRIDFSSRASQDSYINVGDVHKPFNHSFATDAQGNILDNTGKPLTRNDLGLWGQVTWEREATSQNNKPYNSNTPYFDHFAQMFRTSTNLNNSLNISGGAGKTDYSFTMTNINQQSVINSDGSLNRSNFSANIGIELVKNLTLRSTTQFAYTNSSSFGADAGGFLSSALYTWPFADLNNKDKDGNPTYKYGGAGTNSSNPFYQTNYQNYSTKVLDVIPSLNLNYKLSKFLELDYKYGINHSRVDFDRFSQNQEGNPSSVAKNWYVGEGLTGGIAQRNTNRTNQNSLVSAFIRTDFQKDFGLNIPITTSTQVAFDWRRYDFNRDFINYTGLPRYQPVNGAQAQSNSISTWRDQFITYGYLVNQRIEYGDILGLTGGFRADYSSVFNEGRGANVFPRGDGYLRLSKLGFWSGSLADLIPEFKVRAAYGEAGIQPVTYFGGLGGFYGSFPNHYIRTTTLGTGNYDNGSYLSLNAVASNPALKVEVSKEFEFGFDLGIQPNKGGVFLPFINANLTVWNRQGKDVIWPSAQAPTTGIQSKYDNYVVGLSSSGVQATIDAQVFHGTDLTWDLITTFGSQKSFLDQTADGKAIPLTWGSAATYTLRPGEQIGTIYGYKALTSVDQTDPDGNRYIPSSDATKYELVDGRVVNTATKQVQFTNDKYSLGVTAPKFNMSFTNRFNLKRWLDVSFQIDWTAGQKTYNQTKEWMYSEGLHNDFDKPVTIGGQSGNWVAYYRSFYDASESNGTKDYFLENSSFVRLRNASVAVDFAQLFDLKFLRRLQLSYTGRNLLTLTKYSGLDPEANQNVSGGGTGSAAGQVAAQRGLDFWSFPNVKTHQIGLSFGF
ncbi:SusC/RagA family TonB-linked outer membrane protein [Fibrella sp. HMF5335]|uniref:SusC/RagA family TonB-linked outer membrane protein n=1 Tax=Fibrella rubiginis TaxID=2817060 RepID=A0A939K3P0_9BACT|nr:SusC/RagA family TonB-linked outer membrane protein [Fibrella rubiginis]MBO0935336.1 SusC/RagA family TonB-linked outer membrane protein [Fibrella rubiginis]